MHKKLYIKILYGIFITLCLGIYQPSFAIMTPTQSAYATGTGDTVSLSVVGDANATVYLNYVNTSSSVQTSSIGTTDSTGHFTTTLSTASYGVQIGSSYDVTVNGVHSQSATWPYGSSNTNTNTGALALSQTSVTLSVGQSTSVSVTNNSGALFLSGNSNPSVVLTTITNNQVNVTANTTGTTTMTVCLSTNSSMCGSFVVTVTGTTTTSNGSIVFSPSAQTVAYQQSATVTVSGGTGSYMIKSNSNTGVISSTIAGTTLYVYGISSSGGTADIVVCSINTNDCSTITVTSGNSTLSLSQASVTLTPGQLYTIAISGMGNYSLLSNTNSSVASASVSGNAIVGNALSSGSTTVTVCGLYNVCAPLIITVSGTTSNGTATGSIGIIEHVGVGKTVSLTLTGGTLPYAIQNPSSNIVSTYLSGNTLNLSGLIGGQTQISICGASGGCMPIGVYVDTSTVSTGNTSSSNGSYTFTLALKYGSRNSEVMALQEKLKELGMFSGTTTTYFGPATKASLIRFQKSVGLTADGIVGPATRRALNQ